MDGNIEVVRWFISLTVEERLAANNNAAAAIIELREAFNGKKVSDVV